MSGIVSGITKVFSAVGSTVAKVGQAVTGVGATAFTAAAANGAAPIATGGLNPIAGMFGQSTIGRVLSGAAKQAVLGAGLGGLVSAATGNGFMKGAVAGGLAGAVKGGVSGYDATTAGDDVVIATNDSPVVAADTASGFAPTGQTGNAATNVSGAVTAQQATTQPPTATGSTTGQRGIFDRETVGRMLAGAADGYMTQQAKREEAEAYAAEMDKRRAFDQAEQQRITASYHVDPSVRHRRRRFQWNRDNGNMELV